MKNLETNAQIFHYPHSSHFSSNIWEHDNKDFKQIQKIWADEIMIAKNSELQEKNSELQEKNSELEKTVFDLNQKIDLLMKYSEENKHHLEELKYRFSRIWNDRNSIFEHNTRLRRKVNFLIKKKPKRNSKKKTMTLI